MNAVFHYAIKKTEPQEFKGCFERKASFSGQFN